jgi:glucosamine--fructose-6-phosphate aminotransferase (isomerizing)
MEDITMGGIIGIVGETDVAPLLVESLARLGDRRGGVCGLAMLDEEMGIDLRKDVGSVEEVVVRFDMVSAPGELGIAYIQRATHRVLAPENADPHLSCDRSFAVVHNGRDGLDQ